jgi:hypothetical protein
MTKIYPSLSVNDCALAKFLEVDINPNISIKVPF